MSELELQKELMKFKLLNGSNQQHQQHSTFNETLALLIFCFMVMMYFKKESNTYNYIESSRLIKEQPFRQQPRHITNFESFLNPY